MLKTDAQGGTMSGTAYKAPPRSLAFILSLAAGATVANLYYSQPLLAVMASEFMSTPETLGMVPTLTQVGYALGLVLLVPLGDSHERRGLIVKMTILVSLALLAVSFSPNFAWLLVGSFFLGMTTIVPQLVVPFSASLVDPSIRGRFVGQVMSGLLIGIILSRSLSGYAEGYIGWRTIYVIAAVGMLALAMILHLTLPRQFPSRRVPYRDLVKSLVKLVRQEPILRRHALVGAFGFSAFSAFWTPLVFHLQNISSSYGAHTVAMLALLGVTGAFVAPFSGRLSDRFNTKLVNAGALALVVFAFVVLWAGQMSLVVTALGVILLDAGIQASHISNQTQIYALHPDLRSRLNAVYMFSYFLGGAFGSGVGSYLWQHHGWIGVCVLGGGLAAAGIVALLAPAFSEASRVSVNIQSADTTKRL